MTFLEAAIEVLRDAPDPLHFSDIAKTAVERKLLSHVGRDPEAAMRSCLTSALRRAGDESVLERVKPGVYRIREGAELPERAAPPEAPAPKKAKASRAKSKAANEDGAQDESSTARKPRKRGSSARAKASAKQEEVEAAETVAAGDASEATPAAGEDAQASAKVNFSAPSGSGLEGVTDVALVMANAMSRLAEERPELREELEAMQRAEAEEEAAAEEAARRSSRSGSSRGYEGGSRDREGDRGPEVSSAPSRRGRSARPESRDDDERGGRRRRRRRKRGKRVEWSGADGAEARGGAMSKLLDEVAAALEQGGGRSLHVRQIAEQLAAKGLLGGDISEIERAVTAAMLLDVRGRGEGSRFVVAGEARYRLRGSRLPESAAKAEAALRDAAESLERESRAQLRAWLSSLGVRALESIVRIYLEAEGYQVRSVLPPSRGLGRVVVEDLEGGERVLVLVLPGRSRPESDQWAGEADRHRCSSTMTFWPRAGEGSESEPPKGAGRILEATELAAWLERQGLGIRHVELKVPALDPAFIESIAGLDT